MKEIPLAKVASAVVDDEDYPFLSKFKWHVCKTGNKKYAGTREHWKGPFLLMHRVIMKPPKNLEIDHINSDGLDNRKCNLRFATRSLQTISARIDKSNCASKFRGVCWCKTHKKWKVTLRINKKQTLLGYFKDEISAAKIYDVHAFSNYGQFARLNFPPC